jgi:phosphoketolase
MEHVKPLVVGHWGTTPGQNFIYVHLNRVIKKYDLDMFYIAGPGHGGPALWAILTSKAPIVRFIQTSPRTKPG